LEGNNMYKKECEYESVVVKRKMGEDMMRRNGV
jgi:hypothetical protein